MYLLMEGHPAALTIQSFTSSTTYHRLLDFTYSAKKFFHSSATVVEELTLL